MYSSYGVGARARELNISLRGNLVNFVLRPRPQFLCRSILKGSGINVLAFDPPPRVVKRWKVNTVLSVNTNNRTTLDFLNNNKLNVWDFH